MIFGGEVVLFSQKNQRHGDEYADFVLDPGWTGRREHNRDRSGDRSPGAGGGA
jgi:hypothetical protein